jgi:23S rRNA A1618 N6-methylase RlmF
MVVQGGELAFVRAIIADSKVLCGRIHWYSSMCGKKATLKVLRQELHGAGGCGKNFTVQVGCGKNFKMQVWC